MCWSGHIGGWYEVLATARGVCVWVVVLCGGGVL